MKSIRNFPPPVISTLLSSQLSNYSLYSVVRYVSRLLKLTIWLLARLLKRNSLEESGNCRSRHRKDLFVPVKEF